MTEEKKEWTPGPWKVRDNGELKSKIVFPDRLREIDAICEDALRSARESGNG